MLEDLLDSASVGGRRAMTDLQKAAEFFDGDDDRGILLEGLVGIAAGLVDAINGVTVPDEPCGPRCNCGSCDETPIPASACPLTPSKIRFASAEDAIEYRVGRDRDWLQSTETYFCSCGGYHFRTKGRRR